MPKANSFWDHPIATLEKALHIRKQIEALKSSLAGLMGGGEETNGVVAKRRGRPPKTAVVASAGAKVDGRKGKRSAAARAKMAASQKRRWAKIRGESTPAAPAAKSSRKKRTMSPEARERIAAAQRARWAKVKG